MTETIKDALNARCCFRAHSDSWILKEKKLPMNKKAIIPQMFSESEAK